MRIPTQAVHQKSNPLARMPVGRHAIVQHQTVAVGEDDVPISAGTAKSDAAEHLTEDGLNVAIAEARGWLESEGAHGRWRIGAGDFMISRSPSEHNSSRNSPLFHFS
jgi:hypothetical protein